ncbi:Ig-like domain-containing protein [Kitasatospora sp. SUK 42]|uniref:L,D-transpeptidase n=1 Tax=Kitasatospora sp. SUK 42 TaxID=1588882 RepID=UPI0018CB6DD9|nr:Ig-like domain-containing protein [Kitasatospora sp. SUK 42]MBV2153635.1 L,D-transpeptidase family protein [Kitasatospora sp. SUK 42]
MADRRGIAGTTGITGISLALAVLAPVAACTFGGDDEPTGPHRINAARLVHVSAEGTIDPSQSVTVTAVPGSRLTDVTVADPDGRAVAGLLAEDQRSWQSTGRLRPGTAYTVRISAADDRNGRGDTTANFSTVAAQRLLTAKLGPDSSGSGIYGVGQPLTVQLSEAVKDPQARQEVEKVLTVSSQPAVTGAWYWVDDKELHFRPEEYWPVGTTVGLAFDGTGMRIADGLYGGDRSSLRLRIGARVETVIDAAAHVLTLKRDGAVLRNIPVTTGKPGFDTRNGIKVVLGQERSVRMNGETIGLKAGSSESYDLNVEWATRVTWSGEYVHAAPWSVNSQGVSNVSHGCTGMSTDNAKWYFQNTRVGDLVTVVNSRGHSMEPFGNGFGDWNVSWADWFTHSALGQPLTTTAPAAQAPAAGMARPEL